MSDKINRGLLPPAFFFLIITFSLLRSLLAKPNAACNPFVSHSTYFVSIIDVALVIISGYWMCHRVRSEATSKDAEAADVDPETGDKKVEVKVPEEGECFLHV